MDRVIARVLALVAVAILVVVALADGGPVKRALVVAGRRAATAVGWYHATTDMAVTVQPRCMSVAVQAWGQPWIGTTPPALVPEVGRTSAVQDVGVLTRTSYSSATFSDGGGLSVVFRRVGQHRSSDPSC